MKQIIIRPVITEKTMALSVKGSYAFVVESLATKEQIAARIHALYGVHVTDVHTISMHGKARRFGKRSTAHPAVPWKKAIVTVKKGETIEAFDIKTDETPTK